MNGMLWKEQIAEEVICSFLCNKKIITDRLKPLLVL